MPTSASRPCPWPRCSNLQPCPTHARSTDRARGTAHQRGYNGAWLAFRPQFIAALVQAGILPVCGAALPTGPHTQDSQCQAQGLFTYTSTDGSSLHLDHEPELQDWERHNVRAVCDPERIVLLCRECHAQKRKRGVAKC